MSKINQLNTEEQLVNFFGTLANKKITSLFPKEELFTYRIMILNRLISGNSKSENAYIDYAIKYFLKNKNIIDYDNIYTWATLTDIIHTFNKNNIYREELKDLFNMLLDLNAQVNNEIISENKVNKYDLRIFLINWGLANYYEIVENKTDALASYKNVVENLDESKYYDMFKWDLWFAMSRLYYINSIFYVNSNYQEKKYMNNLDSWIIKVNAYDSIKTNFIEAQVTKNNLNRSYALITKDYKKEKIYIDNLKKLTGDSYENMAMAILNEFNQGLITEKEQGDKLKFLYDSLKKPYDGLIIKFLPIEKQFPARLENNLKKFDGIDLYNKLSYDEQISQLIIRNKEYIILQEIFFEMDNGLKKKYLKSFIEYIIKLENYSVNNKELFKNVEYDQLTKLFNKRKEKEVFINSVWDYDLDDFRNKTSLSGDEANKIVFNLTSIKDEIMLLEQEIKKEFKFNEIYLDNIQKKLKDDQAIVRIVRYLNKEKFNDYYSIIISRNSLNLIKLNDEIDFERVYSYYLNKLNTREQDTMSYKYLFEKIHQNLEGIKEVFFINKGIYANVNLESLKLNSKDFLVDQIEIKYFSSLLGIINYESEPLDLKNSLLIGDPVFDIKKKKATPKKPTRSGLYQLPSTRDEINSINKILQENNINTISLLGEDATELNFKNNLRSNLIHIATHGYYKLTDDELPSFGLVLANSGESRLFEKNKNSLYSDTDNVLRGEELKFLNLSETQLLVLSACETAVSYPLMIGNYNLSGEFIRCGVKNVISTIWKIDDQVTQKFMSIFYDILSKNNSIESSLKNTKSIIRKEYPHPYYWSAFVHLKP